MQTIADFAMTIGSSRSSMQLFFSAVRQVLSCASALYSGFAATQDLSTNGLAFRRGCTSGKGEDLMHELGDYARDFRVN